MQKIIIALGGNAIQLKSDIGTIQEQFVNVEKTMLGISSILLDQDKKVVITHGNGPQVGSILIQNAAGKDQVPEMPMYIAGAMSQGQIGLVISQTVGNILSSSSSNRAVATVVTQVAVDPQDQAFENPVKPVGPFYTEQEMAALKSSNDYVYKEDAGRGYRRVVPSPLPTEIVELATIKNSFEAGAIVVAVGGGGIPVVKSGGSLSGVDAVIDKDHASSLLAHNLEADTFIILTAVPQVMLNFGTADEEALPAISISEARSYIEQGHFAEGSMKPKVEAAITFVAGGEGRKALITNPTDFKKALEGKSGTWIIA